MWDWLRYATLLVKKARIRQRSYLNGFCIHWIPNYCFVRLRLFSVILLRRLLTNLTLFAGSSAPPLTRKTQSIINSHFNRQSAWSTRVQLLGQKFKLSWLHWQFIYMNLSHGALFFEILWNFMSLPSTSDAEVLPQKKFVVNDFYSPTKLVHLWSQKFFWQKHVVHYKCLHQQSSSPCSNYVAVGSKPCYYL